MIYLNLLKKLFKILTNLKKFKFKKYTQEKKNLEILKI